MKRGLLVVALVLLVALVAADRVAEQVAEGRVADQLRAELGAEPEVEVEGLPFLTQALRGRYGRVRVAAEQVPGGGVVVRRFAARLSDLRLPPGQALRGRVDAIPVSQLQGSALVAYDDLEAAAGTPGLQLSAEGDLLRVTGRATLLGQDVEASAVSDVRLDGDVLAVSAQRFELAGRPVPEAVGAALRDRFDLRLPVPDLPYGVRLDGLQVLPDGVRVSGVAQDVVLRR